MVITFCGHSDFIGSDVYEKMILDFLLEKVGDRRAEMFLGGYGGFDRFAYECCRKYQKTHPAVCLVYVTPYLEPAHLEREKANYDTILYPDMGNTPRRYAITRRNRYMVENAAYVIAYVKREWGGAWTFWKYAVQKGKFLYNLADFDKV